MCTGISSGLCFVLLKIRLISFHGVRKILSQLLKKLLLVPRRQSKCLTFATDDPVGIPPLYGNSPKEVVRCCCKLKKFSRRWGWRPQGNRTAAIYKSQHKKKFPSRGASWVHCPDIVVGGVSPNKTNTVTSPHCKAETGKGLRLNTSARKRNTFFTTYTGSKLHTCKYETEN